MASPRPPESLDVQQLTKRGVERLSFGDLEGALQLLSQAASSGGDAHAHYQLAICLRQLGRHDEAEVEFKIALAEKPSLSEAWFGLIFLYQEDGRHKEAKILLGKICDQFSDDHQTLHKAGGLMGQLGYYAEAAKLYESIVEAEPESRNYQRLGQYYQKLGRYPDAEAAFLTAIDSNPRAGAAYLLLANTRRITGDEASLVARFESALKQLGLSPDTEACLHFGLGKIYDDQGHYDEAFAHFAQGNQLRKINAPFDAGEWRAFARALGRRSDVFPDNVSRSPTNGVAPLFVVGMLRSGTTLVERILASHPQVHGMGEVNWIAELVGHAKSHTGMDYPALLDMLSDQNINELRAAYVRRWPQEGRNSKYIVDKNPLNFIYLGLIARMFPNARIVHCQRDPRDTGVSIYFQNFANAVNSYAYDLTDIGQFYNGYREVMKYWQRMLPQGMLHAVSYEKLVTQQETETRRLLAAVELGWDAACLEFQTLPDNIVTASVWQARQALYGTAVGRWQHYRSHLKPLLDVLESS